MSPDNQQSHKTVISAGEITIHLKQLKILEQPASLTSMDTDEGGEAQTDEGRGTQTDSSTTSPEVSADFAQPSVACEKKEEKSLTPNATGIPRLGLSSLQPFVKNTKSFRPICFNPTPNKVAQIAS